MYMHTIYVYCMHVCLNMGLSVLFGTPGISVSQPTVVDSLPSCPPIRCGSKWQRGVDHLTGQPFWIWEGHDCYSVPWKCCSNCCSYLAFKDTQSIQKSNLQWPRIWGVWRYLVVWISYPLAPLPFVWKEGIDFTPTSCETKRACLWGLRLTESKTNRLWQSLYLAS